MVLGILAPSSISILKDSVIGFLPVDQGVLGMGARLLLHNHPILAEIGFELVQGQVHRPVDDLYID